MATLTPSVKGGFWGDMFPNTLVLRNESILKRQIAKMMDRLLDTDAIGKALNGAAAGGTATATYTRAKAGEISGSFQSELGGARTIETVTVINRATTSADETNLDDTIYANPVSPTYVANKDGNPRGYPGG